MWRLDCLLTTSRYRGLGHDSDGWDRVSPELPRRSDLAVVGNPPTRGPCRTRHPWRATSLHFLRKYAGPVCPESWAGFSGSHNQSLFAPGEAVTRVAGHTVTL